MSAVLGYALDGFGLLCMDSIARVAFADGRVEYRPTEAIPFRHVPGGFVAATGHAEIAWAALGALGDMEDPETLDGILARVGPPMDEAASLISVANDSTLVALALSAAGEPELGTYHAPGRALRAGPGESVFQAPAGTDRDLALDRFHEWELEVVEAASGSDVIRATAALFAELATRTPTVSGTLRLGILQQHPSGTWQCAQLIHSAHEIVSASNQCISRRFVACESFSLELTP